MRHASKAILPWVLGFLFSCLFIWAISAVFANGIRPKTWDEAVGRYVNAPGSVIRQRSEGWAELHVASHGLTPEGERIFRSPLPKFFLWGDSYAEGIQVDAEERAVSQYNALAMGAMPKGITIADSGLSVADYFFFIPRYEALTENVEAHVVLLTGMRGVLPGRHLDCHSRFLSDPWRLDESLCQPSETALRYGALISHGRLDFLHALYRSVVDYEMRFSVGNMSQDKPLLNETSGEPSRVDLLEGWMFLLKELKRLTKAKVVFLYTPLRPALSNGRILLEDQMEKTHMELFSTLCAVEGVDFVDMTSEFLSFYEQEGRLTMGFFNTPQGQGHLNAAGHALIAKGLYGYFSGMTK